MSTRLTRAVLCSGAATAALTLAVGTASAAPVVLSEGHVDVIDISYEDGELGLGLHDETTGTGVERDPADVTLWVKPEAELAVPSNPAYSFLGSPGDPVWILPQSLDPDLLYAGWAAHEVPAGVFADDTVTVELTSVSGPGDVSSWDIVAAQPVLNFDSGDGLPDAFDVSAGGHHHTNWGFEAEGDYTLTFEASAELPDGTVVTSEPTAYHFTVG
ncbi:choice-of-anchor M domain-containing protein [Streptomyces sp. NPDC049881]|uniref:choice-of-anchor M domain-containing protein n=1 Tax=Streptomyces sp. NPDC049881 TaxID=3155778 RepID=UPI0034163F99